jgi:hypothetical protein
MFSMFFSLGVPCIHPVYFGLRPFAPFQYILLIKKNVCSHASPRPPISVVVRMHHRGATRASQRCEQHHTAQHALLTRCCGKVIGLKLTT